MHQPNSPNVAFTDSSLKSWIFQASLFSLLVCMSDGYKQGSRTIHCVLGRFVTFQRGKGKKVNLIQMFSTRISFCSVWIRLHTESQNLGHRRYRFCKYLIEESSGICKELFKLFQRFSIDCLWKFRVPPSPPRDVAACSMEIKFRAFRSISTESTHPQRGLFRQ